MPTTTRKRSRKQPSISAGKQTAIAPSAASDNGSDPSPLEVLRKLYCSMLKCRMMAERAPSLFPEGNDAHYDLSIGHEAVPVGATAELTNLDTIAASPRNLPARIVQGTPLNDLLRPSPVGCESPASDPFNLGTGTALGHRLEKKRNVVVALCEGATSLEHWHEAFRFAGIHKLPILYVMKSSAAQGSLIAKHSQVFEDISLMAREYGFPGIIVDGNDVVAVWRVAQESIHRARNGAGPTLIECQTDMPAAKDPLAHLEHYMRKRGLWDEGWKGDIVNQIEALMQGPTAD